MAIREAIEISDNVVAVRWAATVGPDAVATMARRLGIESPLEPSLPLALGTSEVTPLEMAVAYAPFANMGWRVKPLAVLRVEDARGRVLEANKPELSKVLDEGVAYLVTDALRGVITRGTAANLAGWLDRPAAGKTGTTDDNENAWFIGYTPDLVASVWVGNDTPSPLPGFGSTLAGPVWPGFITRALATYARSDFPRPGNVVAVPVSAADGLLPNPTSPVVEEIFLDGTQPTEVSPLYGWGGGLEPSLPAIGASPPPPGAHRLPGNAACLWDPRNPARCAPAPSAPSPPPPSGRPAAEPPPPAGP